MTEERSLRLKARLVGVLYLIIIVAAPFAEMIVIQSVMVSGDAAATAANIRAREQFFRLGGAASLVTVFCDVAIAGLLYALLKPVSWTVAATAAFFRLAAIIVVAANAITYFAPLSILSSGVLPQSDAAALAFTALELHQVGYNVALLVFGGHCLLLGWLVARAAFLPRVIGWVLVLAGLCYLLNGFALFIAPAFERLLVPWVLLPPLVGELGLALWLLIAGVDVAKWREQAAAA